MEKIKKAIPIVFQIAIFLVALLVPFFELGFDSDTILTSVALLFTILIGFFIAASTSNYLRLQSLISDEDAKIIAMFRLIKIIQPSTQKEMATIIDRYMISILDYDLLGYTSSTTKEFDELIAAVDEIRPSSEVGKSLMDNLHSIKNDLISIRQESHVAFKRIVSGYHWFILISLALVMSFVLIGLRENTTSSLIVGLSLIALYQSLNLLHKIDSCEFLAKRLGYENPQYVFSAIGKSGYYPEHAIGRKAIKSRLAATPGEYRVGFYRNFPESLEKDIKTFGKKVS